MIMRLSFLAVLVLGAPLLTISACGRGTKVVAEAAIAAPSTVPVIVAAQVRTSVASNLIFATGSIAFERETTFSFKTGGIIAEVRVDEGDRVKAGQLLASLDLTELSAGLAQSDAAVRNAEVQYERTRDLVAKGHLAAARLDDAVFARDQAVAARQAVVFNRDQGLMTADGGGVVLRRFAEPGQTVAPGAPVLRVGETNSGLVLRVPVPAAAAARLKIGDAATFTFAGLAGQRTGKVVRIAAQSDVATGSFEVDISVADTTDLRSGLVGDATITTAEPPATSTAATVRIPTLALLDARADQGYVYVIDEKSIAHRRAVATSGIEGGDVLVISGLSSGEQIVAEGVAYVRDGEPVQIASAR
jgi:RND family efflux transporter MFP subunit